MKPKPLYMEFTLWALVAVCGACIVMTQCIGCAAVRKMTGIETVVNNQRHFETELQANHDLNVSNGVAIGDLLKAGYLIAGYCTLRLLFGVHGKARDWWHRRKTRKAWKAANASAS